MYVRVPMKVSAILQSPRWWIFCVGIPHTTWRIYVLGSLSHQSIWVAVRLRDKRLCRRLLLQQAFSKSRHFSWNIDPNNTMAYDTLPHDWSYQGDVMWKKTFLLGKNWLAWWWSTVCGVRIVYNYWNVSLLRVGVIKFRFFYWIHVYLFILFYLLYLS